MKKYTIWAAYVGDASCTVEANSPEEAVEKAYKERLFIRSEDDFDPDWCNVTDVIEED